MSSISPCSRHYIQELLSTGEACVQLINAGVVVALNHCLCADDETIRERAAADLEILIGVSGAKGCNQMLEDGAIETLLSLLSDDSQSVRNAVYNALVEGCLRSAAIQARLCSTEGTLESLLKKAGEEDPERAACALELIRVCLSGRNSDAGVGLILRRTQPPISGRTCWLSLLDTVRHQHGNFSLCTPLCETMNDLTNRSSCFVWGLSARSLISWTMMTSRW